MKLDRRAGERFLKEPDRRIAAILIHGPDEGLVQERLRAIETAILGPEGRNDPFRHVEISAEAARGDPARLVDEAKAIAMLGGRRVIRLIGAGDPLAGQLADYLDAIPDSDQALLVLAGGELPGRSALKTLFESRANAAAIACYRDETEDLGPLILAHLRAAGLTASRDALDYLAAHLGGDRGVTRSELDKLALYMGEAKKIELADARAAIGDSAAIDLDDLIFALAEGDRAGLDQAIARNLREMPAIAISRALARHFLRLHQIAGRLAEGEALETALAGLRPPLFWKTKARFAAQARTWSPGAIGNALEKLAAIEAEIMRHHDLAEPLLHQGLLRIASLRR